MRFFAAVLLLTLPVVVLQAVGPADLQISQPYVSGAAGGGQGYAYFRIPAAITAQDGTLLAFAEGRVNSGADHGDIDMVLRRSRDQGRTWEPLQVIWNDGKNTCGNPTPVLDRSTGTIWLAMTHNLEMEDRQAIAEGRSTGTRTVWMTHSDDHGATWAAPTDITLSVKLPGWRWYATGPGIGIQLRNGRLVIPATRNDASGPGSAYSLVFYSDDHGKTWVLGGQAGGNLSESQVVELADGRLLLNARSNGSRPQLRGLSISKDRGQSFGPVYHNPALVEPTCQASIIRGTLAADSDANRLLFANPATSTAGRFGRTNMTVKMSFDEGETWPVARELHAGFSAYSSLVMIPDGSIGCLYESGGKVKTERYQKITFARFTLDWLTGGQPKKP